MRLYKVTIRPNTADGKADIIQFLTQTDFKKAADDAEKLTTKKKTEFPNAETVGLEYWGNMELVTP